MQDLCPCGTQKVYSSCCGPYIEEQALPETPEALMRSRYTAFTQANVPYIMKTMTDSALEAFEPVSFQRWVKPLIWDGLAIIEAPAVEENAFFGEVEFIASYHRTDGESFEIHERSQFEKINGRWYYVEGEQPAANVPVRIDKKIGRNDPCHCGSGSKFKKCCGKA